jgi:hypothetical protein
LSHGGSVAGDELAEAVLVDELALPAGVDGLELALELADDDGLVPGYGPRIFDMTS